MKTAVAVLACAAGASAFTTSAKSTKVAVALNSVFDDYVGGVDLRGQKFEFDPVRTPLLADGSWRWSEFSH